MAFGQRPPTRGADTSFPRQGDAAAGPAAAGGATSPPGQSTPMNIGPGGPMPPGNPAAAGGAPNPIMAQVMKMIPPQLMQQIQMNPAILPQLIQKLLPVVLAQMQGGGGAPPGGPAPAAFSGNGPQPPPQQGMIQPPSTEDELAQAQAAMGSTPLR